MSSVIFGDGNADVDGKLCFVGSCEHFGQKTEVSLSAGKSIVVIRKSVKCQVDKSYTGAFDLLHQSFHFVIWSFPKAIHLQKPSTGRFDFLAKGYVIEKHGRIHAEADIFDENVPVILFSSRAFLSVVPTCLQDKLKQYTVL